MVTKGKQGSTTHSGELYTRCLTCQERAYLVPEWRPVKGIHPSMRQYLCQHGHETYKCLSPDALFALAGNSLALLVVHP